MREGYAVTILKWIKTQLAEIYRGAATPLLCGIGGSIWVTSTHVGDAAWPSWIGFVVAAIFWGFALDLEREKARAKGMIEGSAHTIKTLEACDGLDINITHTTAAAKKQRKAEQ